MSTDMTADVAARAAQAAAEDISYDDEGRLVASAAGSWHRLDPKPST